MASLPCAEYELCVPTPNGDAQPNSVAGARMNPTTRPRISALAVAVATRSVATLLVFAPEVFQPT